MKWARAKMWSNIVAKLFLHFIFFIYSLFLRVPFRSLGVHCSKVRSLTLDSWEPELLKVRLPNSFAYSFYFLCCAFFAQLHLKYLLGIELLFFFKLFPPLSPIFVLLPSSLMCSWCVNWVTLWSIKFMREPARSWERKNLDHPVQGLSFTPGGVFGQEK